MNTPQPRWVEQALTTGRTPVEPDPGSYDHQLARRYIPHRAWDLRLYGWLMTWFLRFDDTNPQNFKRIRWRRVKVWLSSRYPNGREFLRVFFLGGRVDEDERERRNAICRVCPYVRVRLPAVPTGRVRRYCGACNCPDWWLSELDLPTRSARRDKNRLAGHVCPQGKHGRRKRWEPALVVGLELQAGRNVPGGGDNGDIDRVAIADRPVEQRGKLDGRHTNPRQGREVGSAVKS